MSTSASSDASNEPVAETAEESPELFLDRDFSWLEFNRRVLALAADDRTPLLERVFFMSIFTSNLDEFFMKRIISLKRHIETGSQRQYPGKRTAQQKAQEMSETIRPLLIRQAKIFTQEIRPALQKEGVYLLNWEELTDEEHDVARRIFRTDVFPVLTPLAVDPGHPFPFISNLSTSLGVELHSPDGGERLFARVKVPQVLPQWIRLETPAFAGQYRFISLLDLIRHNLNDLFPDMVVEDVLPFRITRNANVESDEIELDDDLMEIIEEELRQRRREQPVRLEFPPNPNPWIRQMVVSALKPKEEDVYELPALLDYTTLKEIGGLPIAHLRYHPWNPVTPQPLADEENSIFAVIRAGDMLVHHPYENFNTTVMRFIETAIDDPHVLAIKMTVYRTGSDSPFIPLLIRAAEAGKQVACLVELQARFDEQQNILLAQALEKAGVHVVYGILGLKTHTKTALVVRRETDGVRCYAHIGTGNYHVHTARLYDDLGLLTAEPVLTNEVAEVFNYLTGRSRKASYEKLLVAPVTFKERSLKMIEREVEHHRAGRPARIVAKMNQLEDRDIIQALYFASQAGLPIDLIIRGFCVLRPGVPGLSDNIRVISVIGRFLEHSRIFYFRNGMEDPADGDFYIGSGDWMVRNLERRVEAVTPIEAKPLRERIWKMLEVYVADERSAWDMQPDGSYVQRTPSETATPLQSIGTQQVLMEWAEETRAISVPKVADPG